MAVGCGRQDAPDAPGSPSPTAPVLSIDPLRLDPCDAMSQEEFGGAGVELRVPHRYVSTFSDGQLRFKGCLARSAPAGEAQFYLQATNMTVPYLEYDRARNYSFRRLMIDNREGTVAGNKQYPGLCLVLIQMKDYGLLLDGDFANRSCDRGVEIATKLVPILQDK
ncbi:DUF3558 family protein [Nocardia transvalensis]|uniref:DUF3558 family protein n=1 Tax=Nocardia transvalensis TaxID=37333 RepID=UPI002B4B5D38|nr:DUF3558 family protein [Nocardia transvalensis]